jgi:hypothetical protein
MKFRNGAVNSRRQAKIVGVDNETAHEVSLSTGATRPWPWIDLN